MMSQLAETRKVDPFMAIQPMVSAFRRQLALAATPPDTCLLGRDRGVSFARPYLGNSSTC